LYEAFTVISTEITKRSQNPLRKLLPNGKYKNACQTFNNTISDVVELRFKLLLEQSAQTGGAKSADSLPTDLLSYLVQKDETGHVLEQKAIVGNIRMFLFTGQDTTASSLSFCLWYIAKHEKVQERLYNEINSLMTQRSGSSSRLSDAELRKLPYLDAVLKEALRLCSPAAVAREALQDVTVTNACGQSYVLPKGVQVHITPFVLQRSPRYWPDRPLEFVPERHLKEEEKTKIDRLDGGDTSPENFFVPFSLGPRNCIGQHFATEMRAAVALIVHRYKLQPVPTAIEPCPTITMTSNPHEVLITLSRRA
jgi:cytochrome P450